MKGAIAALVAVIFWGISFVATKAVLAELAPAALVGARFALGTLTLFAILAVRRGGVRPPRESWLPLVAMGFVGVFVHQMVQVHGLALTTAVRTGWLISLIPIWSALLGALVAGERLTGVQRLGLAIGFGGCLLILTRGELGFGSLALPSTRGDLLVLASTLNWAIYGVLGRATLRRVGAQTATAVAVAAGTAMLLPFALAAGMLSGLAALSATGWGALLFLGVGCSGLAYLAWYAALDHLGPTRAAAFLYVEPLVTHAFAVALLGEPVAATTVLGGLVVLAGTVLVQRRGQV